MLIVRCLFPHPLILDDNGSHKENMFWESGLKNEIESYKKLGKHSNAATNRWVRAQRDAHKKGELLKERYEKIIEFMPDFFDIEKLRKQYIIK